MVLRKWEGGLVLKRYFILALICVLTFAVGLLIYGAWLNHRGENAISERMANRVLSLDGAHAQVRAIRPVLHWTTINLYAEQMTDAVARVDGIFNAAYVKNHDHVTQGQAIGYIVNEELPLKLKQIDSNLAKAEAEKKRTYNMYDRQRRLQDQEATSLEKVEESEALYNAALASIDDLQAQRQQMLINMSRQTLSAPIDGEVLMFYRQPGTYVTAGTTLALIGNFQALHFKTSMLDEDIRNFIPSGTQAEISFHQNGFSKIYEAEYGAGNEAENQSFYGHIVEVTPSLAVPARRRNVVWEIDNSSGVLEPQRYNMVSAQTQVVRHALAVPLTSMVNQTKNDDDSTDEGQAWNQVFVLNAEEKLELRDVTTGARDDKYVEIVQGLEAGDIVITSGLEGLESGMRAQVTLEEEEDGGES